MLVIGLRVDAVVVDVLADVLINMCAISGVVRGICGDIVADINLKVVAAVETLSDFTTPAPFED